MSACLSSWQPVSLRGALAGRIYTNIILYYIIINEASDYLAFSRTLAQALLQLPLLLLPQQSGLERARARARV